MIEDDLFSELDPGIFSKKTDEFDCSYLAHAKSTLETVLPMPGMDSEAYSQLTQKGFRRAGFFIYRPACRACQACLPIRVPVKDFLPNRSQKRRLTHLAELTIQERVPTFDEAHYQLFCRYQQARHTSHPLPKDNESRLAYINALVNSAVTTKLIEFTEGETVQIVSLVDELSDGLSAVYTFFNPDKPQAGLGSLAILWQIEQCIARGLPYLYLGYFIEASQKMAYKINFRPFELLIDGKWRAFSSAQEYQLSAPRANS